MDLQQVINSSWGVQLASGLARTAPTSIGHRFARFIADLFASRRHSRLVQSIRLNQWMIHDQSLQGHKLDRIVRETLRHSARSIFDLHHYIQDFEATTRLVTLDEVAAQFIRRREFEERGLVAVGLHMSNFDLVLQWMCKQGLKPLVLTIPNPQGGRRREFEARRKIGMNLVPASVGALKQAVRHLEQGGLIITGLDRPIDNPPASPRFFGHPTALPMHHIYLAQKAHVAVQIFAVVLQPDGKYHVISSERIEMEHHPDREIETLHNAERILDVAESMIRTAPEQWLVPLPVWPDCLQLVPN